MYEKLFNSIRDRVGLADNEAEKIKRFFVPKKIRKRQFLLNAGEICLYIAFVEKGMLRSFSVDQQGHEQVVSFACEGWWISDLSSFLSGDEAVYNIEALEDSELLLLNSESMEEMLNLINGMERYFRLLMQNHIVSLQRRLVASLNYSAEDKYRKLLEINPDIISRAPLQHIASYLGVTPETLSRIRKQVSKKP